MAEFDLLIQNVRIIDGSGGASRRGGVALRADRIAATGTLMNGSARTVIDGEGLALAPGFIDVHTHDDLAVLDTPEMTPKVSQGVTTVVVGNCGISLSPFLPGHAVPAPLTLIGHDTDYRFATFAEYASAIQNNPPAVNVAALIGHTTLRAVAMQSLERAATEPEIEAMSRFLATSLADGAIGLSSGLDYPAAAAAPTAEVVSLCHVLRTHNGIYTAHMRDERDQIADALEETFDIGKKASVPIVISHKKCSGHRNWGRSTETLKRIATARRHHSIDLDCYPYTASSTLLIAKYVDPHEEVLITWCDPHPELAGRYLSRIAADWGCDVYDAVARLTPAGAIYFDMDERDLRRILSFDGTMIGSDGIPGDPHPHPRLWGTFPRVLGHYSRDLGLLSLEEAIHRMTAKPAQVFGFENRGVIAVGNYADLVLFDPATIIDLASFEHPCEAARGIELVMVNGKIAWQSGASARERSGRLLKRFRETANRPRA